jgi:branched-chain amino acid transport system substrate-binding protein
MAGPMTGRMAWIGEQLQRGAELAAADLNAAGGVLGQQLQLVTADDFCDPEQAVAAAKKLVSEGAIFVVGHYCSGSSIPASEVYAAAGVLQISPSSSNPMLTELGRANVFRVQNRDDAVGTAVGNYLADHWPDQKIAILHDGTIFGEGIAEETRKQLNRRGFTEAVYQAYLPGRSDYGAEISGLQAAHIAVAFIGGYHTEIALMAPVAHARGYPLQLIAAVSLGTEEFDLIAGPGAPKERSSLTTLTHADGPKGRPLSSGSERRVSNQRATPSTLMPPFKCGPRRPKKPARWNSRR